MKIRSYFACVLLASCGTMVACGDDGDGGGGNSPAGEARSIGESGKSLNELKADPTNESAMSNILEIYASAQGVAALGFEPSVGDVELAQNAALAKAMRQQAQFASCVSGSNPYTYTNCVVDPSTLNGTMQINGDEISFDFTIDIDPNSFNSAIQDALAQGGQAGGSFSITYQSITVEETTSALTVTDSMIDGVIDFDTMIVGQTRIEVPNFDPITAPLNETISNTVDYQSVQLDADGCAIGGSVTVTQSNTTIGSYNPVTADYGPGCGDVSIR